MYLDHRKKETIQEYIVSQMKKGYALSSLLSINEDWPDGHDFGVSLEKSYRKIPITTIKAMLHKGLIREKSRHTVTDDLQHIEYQISQENEVEFLK